MKLYLLMFAIFWTVLGLWMLISAEQFKSILKTIFKDRVIGKMGYIPLICGVLFLLSASASALAWLVKIIGVLQVVKGVFLLLTNELKLKAILDRWLNLDAKIYRITGAVILTLGLCLFF